MQFGIKCVKGTYEWHLYEREEKSNPHDNLYFPLSQPHYLNENKIKLSEKYTQIAFIESESSQLLHECIRHITETEKNKADLTYDTFVEIVESYKQLYFEQTNERISLEEDQEIISNFTFLEIVHFKYDENGEKIPIYIFVNENPAKDEVFSAIFAYVHKKKATK